MKITHDLAGDIANVLTQKSKAANEILRVKVSMSQLGDAEAAFLAAKKKLG